MKKLLIIIFVVISIVSFSQSQKKINRLKAQENILQLRKGALIVRIFESKRNIELHRKNGKTELADNLQKALDIENHLITLAFKDSLFNFCPVYIIYAKDYTKVLKGEKTGYFLNTKLEIDKNIELKEDFFYFVDRGAVFDEGFQNGDTYESGSKIIVHDAFILKDKKLNQLINPFPFYKKTIGNVFSTRIHYKENLEDIKKRLDLPKLKNNKILDYYIQKYKLKGKELILPYSIYRLNDQLIEYYNKTIVKKKRTPLLRIAPY